MPSQRYYSSVAQQTTVNGALSNSVTTVAVNSLTGYPSAPFCAAIDFGLTSEELVLVTNVSGLNLTVTRGFSGSTAVAHLNGAVFQHVHVSQDFADFSSHLFTSTGVHGIVGSVVGTSDTQTLSNKTLVSPTISGLELTALYDTNGNPILVLTPAASAVNDITITNAATGAAPAIQATGSDTNINLNLQSKGTGTVQSNGVAVADVSSAQTLSNKTVQLAQVTNGSGQKVIGLGSAVSPVNDVLITPTATGVAPTIAAEGADANINLNLGSKGTGSVLVNGVTVADISSAQTLTQKNFSTATTVGAAGTDISGAWTPYTPTISNMTLGSGSIYAAYQIVGKTCTVRITMNASPGTPGTPTSYTGNGVTFSLPAAAPAIGSTEQHGGCHIYGANPAPGFLTVSGSTAIVWMPVSSTSIHCNQMSSGTLNPGTTGNLEAVFTYETA